MLALVTREGLRMLSSTIGDATPEFLDYAQLHHHHHQDHEQCKESVRSFTFNERYPQDASSDIQYDVQSNDEKKEWIIKKERARLSEELRQARFMIVESEKELMSLFKIYLDRLGVESEMVDDGDTALSSFLQGKKEGKKYDAIVLDTNLRGKRGLEVAKEIHKNVKTQKVILVTTSMKEQLSKEELQTAAIDEKHILVMPFSLSSLPNLLINDLLTR
jgi:CheY-like chemotaxis protein